MAALKGPLNWIALAHAPCQTQAPRPCSGPFFSNFGIRTLVNGRFTMIQSDLQKTIDAAWDARDKISPASQGPERQAVEAALEGLDSGKLRVAEKLNGEWRVHQWLKKAVLLSFRLNDMSLIAGAAGDASW